MPIEFYGHPFSSYCQKTLIALYENDTPFEWRLISPENAEISAQFAELWPIKRFPILVNKGRTVMEASVIIEYLDTNYPGTARLIPAETQSALDVRLMDRIFDNYVSTPLQKIVLNELCDEPDRDPHGVTEARRMLDAAYAWLEHAVTGRQWAVGDDFSLADCAAAPALFYADWAHAIPAAHVHLKAYRTRLLARPSFARAVDEARPYRSYFPLGAPDRD
ncbi:MAG: glutathione S-transferase family protein [Pseudomonadota bacterium]|nr:glutathione S-transferase family protein [Pseudomonadota bacterium]